MNLLQVAQETGDQSKIYEVISARQAVEELYAKGKSIEENCEL